MLWFSLRPRDPADPRWPLPDRPEVSLKAEDADDARRRFEEAYPSRPFGTPSTPVPNAGPASFKGDDAALIVEETQAPPSPSE